MKSETYIPVLQNIDLFKNFTKNDLSRLFNDDNCFISNYERKSSIYIQHEVCKSFDIILSGNALIQTIDENGNILIITSFGVGHSLGGNLILSDNNTYPMGVVAKDYTTLLKIKKDLILNLCQIDKNFLIEFIRDISNRSFFLSTKLRTMTMKTIREQIIDYLVYQYHSQGKLKIKLDMSKKEWSEKLGVHRPSLSRELARMKNDGLIEYDKNSILIKDLKLLNKNL